MYVYTLTRREKGKSDGKSTEEARLFPYNITIHFQKIVVGMSRSRRGEVQILIDILGTSLKGVKVTRLMYKANLSYSTLRKYLSAMSKQGLIVKVCNDDGSVVYCATEKGKLVLDRLKEVKCVLRV